MKTFPKEVSQVETVQPGFADDILILAASWEERCLGLAGRLSNYSCQTVLLTVYDGPSRRREKHISLLTELLAPIGKLQQVPALHANPLPNVRETVDRVRSIAGNRVPRITLDISTFTRKHLLQLLQGLDLAGMMEDCRLYYTEQMDYHTQDDEPISKGISSVKAVESFSGRNTPSRDSLLVLFLGFEGTRARALWEHLEPNMTVAVISDPPHREEWRDRAEAQNRYLLSCMPREQVFRAHSRDPRSTEKLLCGLADDPEYSIEKYNYSIAPIGPKPQTVGLYRFWRRHRGLVTVVYASPTRYRDELAPFPPARTWLVDDSRTWA